MYILTAIQTNRTQEDFPQENGEMTQNNIMKIYVYSPKYYDRGQVFKTHSKNIRDQLDLKNTGREK